MNNGDPALEGVWFSTSDLKLAVSLHAAGFPLKYGGEVTRIVREGTESFTWHFNGSNDLGEKIADFVAAWERPAPAGTQRPGSMECFLLAREVMFSRTHIIAESHKVPRHQFYNRGDIRLAVTPRLSREERQKLAQLAS